MNTIRLLISVFLFALSMNGWCEEFVVDGIYYYTNEDNISVFVVRSDNGYQGEIVIPSSVTYNEKSYSVTGIGKYAFERCKDLTSLTIAEGVTSIGNYAFWGCTGLTSLTIPSSVTSIGLSAFHGCYIDSTKVINNSEVTLEDLTICNRTEENLCIQNGSFIAYLGDATSVTIPEGVTSIGKEVFAGCTDLTSVTIPEGVTSIGKSAFEDCISLTSITIPGSVTSIGEYAFFCCTGLTSVTIPEGVTSIGNYAFACCKGLTSVTIPESVTSIGYYVLALCSGLTSIIVDKENKVYDSRDNCNAIIESQSNTLIAVCGKTFIPKSVTSIGEGAFYGCSGFTSVTIHEGVTSIGIRAFSGFSGLTSVTIPSSMTKIGYFAFENCSGLSTIICNIENPLFLSSTAFSDVDMSKCVLYVPAGCVDAYKAAIVWREFENIREIDPTSIDNVTDKDINTADAIYNLRGQKVSAGYRGIVIRNGKKVLGK